MKYIECRLHVNNCRLSAIGRQEGVYGSEIRLSGCGKPSNAANETLVSLSSSELCGGIVGASVEGAILESTGIPDWYGVAQVEFPFMSCKEDSMRLEAKPN